MRRPVIYLAGLLLATGASLALAGPAQAAVSHGSATSGQSAASHDWCDDDDHYFHHDHVRHFHHHHGHGGGIHGSYNGILNGNTVAILDF